MIKTITALDMESSGWKGYPIQVGVIRTDGKTYKSLIKPHKEWLSDLEWSYNAQCIHKMKKEYVIENGRDLTVVANELNNFLTTTDVYVDSRYDVMWLDLLFEFAEVKRTFKMFVIDDICPEDFTIHWSLMFERTRKLSGLPLHDALNDAKLIQRTFIAIAKHF